MSTYFIGTTPDQILGDKKRYFYGIRKNNSGELFLGKSDQLIGTDNIVINNPGDPEENYENFIGNVDFFNGRNLDRELEYKNLKYEQYRWDNSDIYYYINSEGELVASIGQSHIYNDLDSSGL